jgi:hypothetical protein
VTLASHDRSKHPQRINSPKQPTLSYAQQPSARSVCAHSLSVSSKITPAIGLANTNPSRLAASTPALSRQIFGGSQFRAETRPPGRAASYWSSERGMKLINPQLTRSFALIQISIARPDPRVDFLGHILPGRALVWPRGVGVAAPYA